MNIIQKTNTASFSNGPTCTGYEYPFGDKDMNIAVVIVNGRYPEEGYVMNEVCKEMGYVLSGSGSISLADGDTRDLRPGDAVMIQPGEKFFWQGKLLEMLMPCSPAFYPEQHKALR